MNQRKAQMHLCGAVSGVVLKEMTFKYCLRDVGMLLLLLSCYLKFCKGYTAHHFKFSANSSLRQTASNKVSKEIINSLAKLIFIP